MRNFIASMLLLVSVSTFSQVTLHTRFGFPGHCNVSVGDSLFYQFGNYGRKSVFRLLPMIGQVQFSSRQFDSMKRSKSVVLDIEASEVARRCDSLRSITLKYRFLKYNCTTFVCDVLGQKRVLAPIMFHNKMSGKYYVDWRKATGWVVMGFAGSIWGAREAFYADERVFERKWGVDPYSFFGSHQWERKYKGNRYLNSDGTVNPIKTQLFGNFGRDYWHTSKYLVWGAGTVFMFERGLSKQKFWHKVIDIAVGGVLFSASSNLTYQILRK